MRSLVLKLVLGNYTVQPRGGSCVALVNAKSGSMRNATARAKKSSRVHASSQEKPFWVRDLEEDAPFDEDAAAVLEGTDGDPRKIRANMRKAQKQKYEEIMSRSGEPTPVRIFFREIDPFDLWIWLELYNPPSESEKNILKAAIEAWFTVGKLGGFNASNLQVVRKGEDDISYFEYDYEDKDEQKLDSFFHEMSEIEFSKEWARFSVDMGTADELSLDCFINMITTFSLEHVGIKKVLIGGENQNWPRPKQAKSDMEVPKGLMDFAAYARASQVDPPNVATGDKMKIGDTTYTVEDIPKDK